MIPLYPKYKKSGAKVWVYLAYDNLFSKKKKKLKIIKTKGVYFNRGVDFYIKMLYISSMKRIISPVTGKKIRDITGQRFGILTAIKPTIKVGRNHKWLCKCDCGNKKEISVKQLTRTDRGDKPPTRSCGCIGTKPLEHYGGYKGVHKSYFTSLKHGAKARNIEFKVTIEEIGDLLEAQENKCALSGEEIEFTSYGIKTASLDRIDSNKGYTIDNIQWLHKDVNRMKLNLCQERFIELCKKIST